MLSNHHRKASQSSIRSLSSAFPVAASKSSPKLAPTASEIQATTANSYDGLLLQPKQTSGFLHGVFNDHDKVATERAEQAKACVSIYIIFREDILLLAVLIAESVQLRHEYAA